MNLWLLMIVGALHFHNLVMLAGFGFTWQLIVRSDYRRIAEA